jgi:hypothetical protein
MAKTKKGSNAQFTGAQLGLTIIGDHCYAFSGSYGMNTSAQTLLEFSTGKGYISATVGCCGAVNPASIGAGSIGLFRIYLNGITVAQVKIGSSDEAQPTVSEQTIIIPPLTTVKVDYKDVSTNAAYKVQAYVTGKVYA